MHKFYENLILTETVLIILTSNKKSTSFLKSVQTPPKYILRSIKIIDFIKYLRIVIYKLHTINKIQKTRAIKTDKCTFCIILDRGNGILNGT